MYRDDRNALVMQIDALRRDLADAQNDKQRVAELERKLAAAQMELAHLRPSGSLSFDWRWRLARAAFILVAVSILLVVRKGC